MKNGTPRDELKNGRGRGWVALQLPTGKTKIMEGLSWVQTTPHLGARNLQNLGNPKDPAVQKTLRRYRKKTVNYTPARKDYIHKF